MALVPSSGPQPFRHQGFPSINPPSNPQALFPMPLPCLANWPGGSYKSPSCVVAVPVPVSLPPLPVFAWRLFGPRPVTPLPLPNQHTTRYAFPIPPPLARGPEWPRTCPFYSQADSYPFFAFRGLPFPPPPFGIVPPPPPPPPPMKREKPPVHWHWPRHGGPAPQKAPVSPFGTPLIFFSSRLFSPAFTPIQNCPPAVGLKHATFPPWPGPRPHLKTKPENFPSPETFRLPHRYLVRPPRRWRLFPPGKSAPPFPPKLPSP